MYGEKAADTDATLDKIKEVMMGLVATQTNKAGSKKTTGQMEGIIERETGNDDLKKEEDKKDNIALDENYHKGLFEKKKIKIFNKMKMRQKQFISFQNTTVDLLVKEINDGQTHEDSVCSVSRVPLSSKSTYFMYAQLHFSNVILFH